MTKKVYELAKEMGLTSKALQEKAQGMGINLKSHMSALSDADINKLKGDSKDQEPAQSKGAAHRPKPPMGKPIIDNAYLEAKGKGKVVEKEKVTPEKKQEEVKIRESLNKVEIPKSKENEKKAVESIKKMEVSKEMTGVSREKPAEPKEKAETPKVVVNRRVSYTKPQSKTGDSTRRSEGDRSRNTGDRTRNTGDRRDYKPRTGGEGRDDRSRNTGDRRDYRPRTSGDRRDDRSRQPGDRRDYKPRTGGDGRDDRQRPTGDRRDYKPRTGGEGRDDRPRPTGDRRDYKPRTGGEGRDDRPRSTGDRRNDRPKPYGQRTAGGRTEKPTLDKITTKSDHGKRADNKKNHEKYDKEKKNKFNRFEKAGSSNKNLEKKSRKKHIKAKPQVIETEIIEETLPEGTIVLNIPITVAGFCEQTEVSQARVIMALMKMGIMANINQTIDEDTVAILAEDLGLEIVIGDVEKEAEEEGIEVFEDKDEDLKARPPIITVMGHVDHGKTSLLDAIRKTNVTASESGGITQHIGASEVSIKGQKIVFLDTPGHEAFTAMRARGAHVTDIAVLVVAADDSVKPQTIESISHAKAAGVPVIVAINKMDKAGANPDRVKQDLTEHGILVEDWGGDVICVPVSAKTGDGIINLLEMILLQAEVLELKANPSRLAMGSVIEARLDKAKGPVATLLVTNGTLHSGESIVAGTCSGRIRLMTDYKGKTIKKAGPATAVEILGLTDVPQAGDEFNGVKEDKIAREIAESRKIKLREEVLARNASTTLEKLFSQIQDGEVKELNLIIKGDVQGSVGALVASLEKLNNENVKVNIIHTGVGTVNESDVMLAGTSGAIIIGFNVRPSTTVSNLADRESIQIRTYRVIYDVIDDVENAMKGMLDPEFKEEVLGKVEIRNTFKVPGVGIIGGAYVLEGKVIRNAEVRLVRDGIVFHEGKISSLKRFKDDAKEVAQGYECGIGLADYNDIKEGDIIECFHMVEIERK